MSRVKRFFKTRPVDQDDPQPVIEIARHPQPPHTVSPSPDWKRNSTAMDICPLEKSASTLNQHEKQTPDAHPALPPDSHHALPEATHLHDHHPATPDAFAPASTTQTIITVRALSGLSGDMMLSGLAALAGLSQADLDSLVRELKLPVLEGCLGVGPRTVNHIAGVGCSITLSHDHSHRNLSDIIDIISHSNMPENARTYAIQAFTLLAEAEAAVHEKTPDAVTFHEVGALDSILDTCLVCRIFSMIAPARFVCSPLPLADGVIRCAHGRIPAPAPAVLRMLEDVPVRGFSGEGETVTPTALSLLKALGATFGPWPEMIVEKTVISYGGKVFENAPNGAVWAMGVKAI
ncbi:DUF111 family protein [Desulfosarcina sp. OttesenSCG-928-G10]|nr:DUF111 family protein [Desulfosarcina sp. OttesenSCG-928-G10]MDL2320899.1 DUF111 family protein [Desulfosarcina sp. OttesenSCG-928-B08]